MRISPFPKIFAVGSPHIPTLFKGEVEITEKIDGSQFVFGKIDDELWMRSKGALLHIDAPQQMFEEGVRYIEDVSHRLPNNVVFYSEWLRQPKHNVLKYARTPKNGIALFGVQFLSTGHFVSQHDRLCEFAKALDVETVQLLHKGPVDDIDMLDKLLNTESQLGGADVEGIVVKNYGQDFWLGGQLMPLTAGKYVSEKFKEIHRKNWSKENTAGGKWQVFKDQYCTETRWEKAVQHLRDKGELEREPRDIGKLIKEVRSDITEEEKETIKEFLWKQFGDELLRNSTKGLPEWYKHKLAEDSFK